MNAVIIGVSGRMGQALVRVASEFPDAHASPVRWRLTGSASLGRTPACWRAWTRSASQVTGDLAAALAAADVVIDFSQPHATRANLAACRAARKPLLIGTTGFAAELTKRSSMPPRARFPLLVAPNTSLGSALLIELVRQAARALPPDFDIEIIEAHHRMKRDAPSGTAMALARAAGEGRGWRAGGAPRGSAPADRAPAAGEIGFAVVRGGDIVGEHTVLFAGPGEELRLSHRAADRASLPAGRSGPRYGWRVRPPGRYWHE